MLCCARFSIDTFYLEGLHLFIGCKAWLTEALFYGINYQINSLKVERKGKERLAVHFQPRSVQVLDAFVEELDQKWRDLWFCRELMSRMLKSYHLFGCSLVLT